MTTIHERLHLFVIYTRPLFSPHSLFMKFCNQGPCIQCETPSSECITTGWHQMINCTDSSQAEISWHHCNPHDFYGIVYTHQFVVFWEILSAVLLIMSMVLLKRREKSLQNFHSNRIRNTIASSSSFSSFDQL